MVGSASESLPWVMLNGRVTLEPYVRTDKPNLHILIRHVQGCITTNVGCEIIRIPSAVKASCLGELSVEINPIGLRIGRSEGLASHLATKYNNVVVAQDVSMVEFGYQ